MRGWGAARCIYCVLRGDIDKVVIVVAEAICSIVRLRLGLSLP